MWAALPRYREAIAPSLGVFKSVASYHIDRDKREVTATLAGAFRSRAVYRGAEGCLVVQGRSPSAGQGATWRRVFNVGGLSVCVVILTYRDSLDAHRELAPVDLQSVAEEWRVAAVRPQR